MQKNLKAIAVVLFGVVSLLFSLLCVLVGLLACVPWAAYLIASVGFDMGREWLLEKTDYWLSKILRDLDVE